MDQGHWPLLDSLGVLSTHQAGPYSLGPMSPLVVFVLLVNWVSHLLLKGSAVEDGPFNHYLVSCFRVLLAVWLGELAKFDVISLSW
jgi:hypothetical protein